MTASERLISQVEAWRKTVQPAAKIVIDRYAPDVVQLSWLEEPEDLRRKGHGTEAMSVITTLADEHEVVITLSVVNPDFNIVDWYEKFGFIKFDESSPARTNMCRMPSFERRLRKCVNEILVMSRKERPSDDDGVLWPQPEAICYGINVGLENPLYLSFINLQELVFLVADEILLHPELIHFDASKVAFYTHNNRLKWRQL